MEVPSIIIAVASAIAGPGASVWVAKLTAGRTLDELEKRIVTLETTEPEVIAKLRADLEKAQVDLATVRREFDARAREDDGRRAEARKNARDREKEQNAVIQALTVELARLQVMLTERTSALSQRMEDHRGGR